MTRFLHITLFLVLQVTFSGLFAQSNSLLQMQKDIAFLTSEELQGRLSGTKEAEKAANYIAERMKSIGLVAIGDEGSFLHPFNLYFPVNFENATLKINNKSYKYPDDFKIADFSAQGSTSGNLCINKQRGLISSLCDEFKDVDGKIIVYDIANAPNFENKDEYFISLLNKLKEIEKKGAKSIILHNSSNDSNKEFFFGSPFIDPLSIPVLFINKNVFNSIHKQSGKPCELSVSVKRTVTHPTNVIGAINNNSDKTVIVGAHFDHLGMKVNPESGRREIYYGADDNASGVAMMLQLAEWVVNNESLNNNYVFIAFDAEEKGLLGSQAFLINKKVSDKNIKYMLNIDMVGRLGVMGDSVNISGTNSSKNWDELISQIENYGFGIKKNKKSSPTSDHFPFYIKKIPVCYINTGLHSQYHKPTDTIDKINFDGMAKVLGFLREFLRKADRENNFRFNN